MDAWDQTQSALCNSSALLISISLVLFLYLYSFIKYKIYITMDRNENITYKGIKSGKIYKVKCNN